MFLLFEIIIANVSDQLMYRRLKLQQSINLVEFDLRFASADLKSFPEARMIVSSANSLESISSIYAGKSFIYMINKNGPMIEPWGTP